MFGSFIERLTKAPAKETSGDGRVALGALMVRIAHADGVYLQSEKDSIDRLLAARFGLSPFEATALRQQAEVAEAEASDAVRFTQRLKDAVPLEERVELVEILWSVVLADEDRDHDEDAQMRMIVNLLGINDRDSALARQRAAAK